MARDPGSISTQLVSRCGPGGASHCSGAFPEQKYGTGLPGLLHTSAGACWTNRDHPCVCLAPLGVFILSRSKVSGGRLFFSLILLPNKATSDLSARCSSSPALVCNPPSVCLSVANITCLCCADAGRGLDCPSFISACCPPSHFPSPVVQLASATSVGSQGWPRAAYTRNVLSTAEEKASLSGSSNK